MTGARRSPSAPRWVAWLVLAIAGVLLLGTVGLAAWSFTRPYPAAGGGNPQVGGYGPRMGADGGRWGGGVPGGMMGGRQAGPNVGGGMMSGHIWLAGDGVRVDTIAQARARATQASASSGLKPGEVMQFSNNFYVELKDTAGNPTTEVLVDVATGAVTTEYGPAMMWNTGNRTAAISPDQAITVANQWLSANAPGQTAGTAEAYPGYYTIDTSTNGTKTGMLSVNATTGAVWYHTWHGRFIAEEDA